MPKLPPQLPSQAATVTTEQDLVAHGAQKREDLTRQREAFLKLRSKFVKKPGMNKYVGEFFIIQDKHGVIVEKQKHGQGVISSKNGSFYKGEWRNNKKHGRGESL